MKNIKQNNEQKNLIICLNIKPEALFVLEVSPLRLWVGSKHDSPSHSKNIHECHQQNQNKCHWLEFKKLKIYLFSFYCFPCMWLKMSTKNCYVIIPYSLTLCSARGWEGGIFQTCQHLLGPGVTFWDLNPNQAFYSITFKLLRLGSLMHILQNKITLWAYAILTLYAKRVQGLWK